MDKAPPPNSDEERFRLNMRLYRDRNGWSQGELSRRLLNAGWTIFHQTTVSRIEAGERPIKLGEARAITAVLGATLEQMLAAPEEVKLVDSLTAAIRSLYECQLRADQALADLKACHQSVIDACNDIGLRTSQGWRDASLRDRARGLILQAEDALSVVEQAKYGLEHTRMEGLFSAFEGGNNGEHQEEA